MKSLPISRCCRATLTRCERRNSIPIRCGQPVPSMERRICITERVAPTIRRGRHAGWPRLLLMTGRTNAIDAILVFRRSVPLRLLRLLSKTALSTTLIDSKRLWKTTSNAATKNSNLSVRPRMRPTVRAMRLTRPLKRFPASARVSPHLAVTAWSPLQFRVTLPAPINLTPRLTRQSGLAIAVLSLPRCWPPMRRRRKTTCFRDFSRH